MKFVTFVPTARLSPFVSHLAISEHTTAETYRVLPVTGMVMGFQYAGGLSLLSENSVIALDACGITGICDRFRLFRNEAGTGTVLVYLTPTGFGRFHRLPAGELSGHSLPMNSLFPKHELSRLQERLSLAENDEQRIQHTEQFLLSQVNESIADRLVEEALRLIRQAQGNIRIEALSKQLFISKRPLEKRFQQLVGTTPKKFCDLMRMQAVISVMEREKRLTDICYESGFFDPAHFSKAFRQFTGESPDSFRRQG